MEELLTDLARMEWDWSYHQILKALGERHSPGDPEMFMRHIHALADAVRYLTPLRLTQLVGKYRDAR